MKFQILSLCAVLLVSASVVRGNFIDKLDDFKDNIVEKVTGKHHDELKSEAATEEHGSTGESTEIDPEKKKENDEEEHHSRYEGGIGKQIVHSAADAVLERMIYEAKERAPSALLKPVISMAASKIRDTVHDKINDFGDSDENEHKSEGQEAHEEEKHESLMEKLFRRKREAKAEV